MRGASPLTTIYEPSKCSVAERHERGKPSHYYTRAFEVLRSVVVAPLASANARCPCHAHHPSLGQKAPATLRFIVFFSS